MPVKFTAEEAKNLTKVAKKNPLQFNPYDLKQMFKACESNDEPLTVERVEKCWFELIRVYASLGFTNVTLPVYFLGDYDLVSEILSGSPFDYKDSAHDFTITTAKPLNGMGKDGEFPGQPYEYICISW